MRCRHCGGGLAVLKPKCDFCSEPFQQDQQTQIVPPISAVKFGAKSGQMILVPIADEWDIVHLHCAQEYHNPEYNGGVDQLREMFRDELVEELADGLKDQIYAELADEAGVVCSECLDELDIERMSDESKIELWHKAYRTIEILQKYFPKQS